METRILHRPLTPKVILRMPLPGELQTAHGQERRILAKGKI